MHRPQRRYPSRCTSSTLNHLGVLKVRVFSGFSTYSLLDFGHFHIVSKSLSRVMPRSPVSSRASICQAHAPTSDKSQPRRRHSYSCPHCSECRMYLRWAPAGPLCLIGVLRLECSKPSASCPTEGGVSSIKAVSEVIEQANILEFYSLFARLPGAQRRPPRTGRPHDPASRRLEVP